MRQFWQIKYKKRLLRTLLGKTLKRRPTGWWMPSSSALYLPLAGNSDMKPRMSHLSWDWEDRQEAVFWHKGARHTTKGTKRTLGWKNKTPNFSSHYFKFYCSQMNAINNWHTMPSWPVQMSRWIHKFIPVREQNPNGGFSEIDVIICWITPEYVKLSCFYFLLKWFKNFYLFINLIENK